MGDIDILVCDRAGQYYNIIVNRDIKHHNNRYRREIFSIVISVAQYYCQYHEYCKVFAQQHPDFCNISEILHTIIHNFNACSTVTISSADIAIISIIGIFTVMIIVI